MYALGSDLSVNEHFSLVFDLARPTRARLAAPADHLVHGHGRGGSVTLPDITFTQTSDWTSVGRPRLQGQRRRRVLLDFNLRFRISENGLVDRIAPLMGIEWSF